MPMRSKPPTRPNLPLDIMYTYASHPFLHTTPYPKRAPPRINATTAEITSMDGTPPNTDNDSPSNVPLMEILAYVKVAEHYVPMRVLLDNGADRSYISKDFVHKHCIRTEALHISQRFNVEAAFGQKEHVHQRTAPIPFRIDDHFEEPTRFNIACLKSFDAIVGLDWLYQHDAAIFVRSRKLQWTYKNGCSRWSWATCQLSPNRGCRVCNPRRRQLRHPRLPTTISHIPLRQDARRPLRPRLNLTTEPLMLPYLQTNSVNIAGATAKT